MEVAGHLDVQVERIEMEKALRKPGDLTAWEALMRSMSAFGRLSPDSIRDAIVDARQAVAIAADYALGHAVLAQFLGNIYMMTGGRDEAIARECRTHARRALTLDSGDPRILSQVALGMGWLGSWQEALEYAQRAVGLNPNIASCHLNLALVCLHFIRPDDAIVHVDAALVLAPRGYLTYVGLSYKSMAHFLTGRYEQALLTVDQALLLYPFMYSVKDKIVYCETLGRHEEARDGVRRLRAIVQSGALDDIERANAIVFAPETARDLNATLRKVWMETPLESPGGMSSGGWPPV
jgi:tetratricopeptide (TPR) repeat protein